MWNQRLGELVPGSPQVQHWDISRRMTMRQFNRKSQCQRSVAQDLAEKVSHLLVTMRLLLQLTMKPRWHQRHVATLIQIAWTLSCCTTRGQSTGYTFRIFQCQPEQRLIPVLASHYLLSHKLHRVLKAFSLLNILSPHYCLTVWRVCLWLLVHISQSFPHTNIFLQYLHLMMHCPHKSLQLLMKVHV